MDTSQVYRSIKLMFKIQKYIFASWSWFKRNLLSNSLMPLSSLKKGQYIIKYLKQLTFSSLFVCVIYNTICLIPSTHHWDIVDTKAHPSFLLVSSTIANQSWTCPNIQRFLPLTGHNLESLDAMAKP